MGTFEELAELRLWLQHECGGPTGDDRLRTLAGELEQLVAAGVAGAVAEIGCCKGATAL